MVCELGAQMYLALIDPASGSIAASTFVPASLAASPFVAPSPVAASPPVTVAPSGPVPCPPSAPPLDVAAPLSLSAAFGRVLLEPQAGGTGATPGGNPTAGR